MIGRPYYPLTLCADGNNDGSIDAEDEVMFDAAFGSIEGSPNYNPHFDYDLKGGIDPIDRIRFRDQMAYANNLDVIRLQTDRGMFAKLTWPDGWEAWLSAVNWQGIRRFTGWGAEEMGIGYIHVMAALQPIFGGQGVGCTTYSRLTATCAYKALGYGRLLEAGTQGHGYNIFWIGGDWHNLSNWWVLEPQSGGAFPADNCGGWHRTSSIRFDDYWQMEEGYDGLCIYGHWLDVDYAERRVTYGGTWRKTRRNYGWYNMEPLPPNGVFDRTLGINKEMLLGDVNGDGKIDSADFQLIIQHILGTITLEGDQAIRANVNKDGKIDVADAQMVIQEILNGFSGGFDG